VSFLNPLLLLGALGISLPILAHLLNRYRVQRTPWAAMRFLNRSVRVRSRQLRLKDALLLALRCLAILLLTLALARPVLTPGDGAVGKLGEPRAGLVIALDTSFSMMHRDDGPTRFQRAIERVNQIAATVRPGDPVTLCLLGSDVRVAVRNMAFDPSAFDRLLGDLQPTHETLDLDGVPGQLAQLAAEIKAPQKEIYIVSDFQEADWATGNAWLGDSLKRLAEDASVFIVPIEGGAENLAIVDLDLLSGVLRRGTTARYRATVRNCGTTPARNVRVDGRVNNITVDSKVIPAIAPGASETVSLFLSFRDPGPVRITAAIGEDGLEADNTRRTVAVVRDRASVLCVQGDLDETNGAAGLIAEALRARGDEEQEDDLDVQSVSWVELPAQDLNAFDVVILADVPDITPEQARRFEQYVREGRGLIWFGGEQVKADLWNSRSATGQARLLPATIGPALNTSDTMGIGRPLDPTMSDHAVSRPLRSLPEDLLSETRFRKVVELEPLTTSATVLSLAGSDVPVLVEQSMGRGHVFMFATSAGPSWNNMAVTPVFPMLLQQMVTYLTAREFETPRRVVDPLLLAYEDRPNTTDAVFDAPSGDSINVPVREFRNQYVAVLDQAKEVGFYQARANLHAEGRPIAVNVDPRESVVKCLTADQAAAQWRDAGVRVVGSEMDLAAGIDAARQTRSLWKVFLIAGLAMLFAESFFADWLVRRSSKPGRAGGEVVE
jgi:uncharacterized membrane protein